VQGGYGVHGLGNGGGCGLGDGDGKGDGDGGCRPGFQPATAGLTQERKSSRWLTRVRPSTMASKAARARVSLMFHFVLDPVHPEGGSLKGGSTDNSR